MPGRQHALILTPIVLAAAIPSLWHVNLAAAPAWAIVLFLGSLLLLAYLVWLATIPHSAALWCVTWAFAAAAALAVTTFAALLFTRAGPLPLEIESSRPIAMTWSAIAAALYSAASLLTGRLAVIQSKTSRIADVFNLKSEI